MQKKDKSDNETACHLGKNAEFEGELKFYGAARIEGRFKGNISGEGTLEVAKDAKIEADIYVTRVIASGEIHGNISAEEKIEIQAAGKVFGRIEAPVITLEAGAVFQGKSRTQKPKVTDKEELQIKSSVKTKSERARPTK